MNKNQITAKIKQHLTKFKADPDAETEAIGLDYDKADADAIIKGLKEVTATPEPDKKSKTADSNVAKQQANHPTMKWFDEFHVRVVKKEVRSPYTQKIETIITGWDLVKKLMPKFIEPMQATQLNSFANGYQIENLGCLLILKDEMTIGETITYEAWAKQQGFNLKKDMNIILLEFVED